MSSPVQIRAGTANDIALLKEMICELADYEHLRGEVVATEDQLRTTLFGPKRFAEFFLAFEGEVAVGFTVYFFGYSTFKAKPTLFVEDLFVREVSRRRGVGRQLFHVLLRVAQGSDCARVEWSVLDWNQSAIEFYRKLGAKEIEGWRRYRLSEPSFPAALKSLQAVA